jgi:ribonuclease HI
VRATIHTDGGCLGNPGPGAWAYVISGDGAEREGAGFCPATTNNRMELAAVIESLKAASADANLRAAPIDLFTDSQYVQKGISEWMRNWERNGWKTSGKTPVKNADLWKELKALSDDLRVTWHWLPGHAGHDANERCHSLVEGEIKRRA